MLCLLSLATLLAALPAQAQTLPERPTLTPVPSSDQGGGSSEHAAAASGRITGTVIDSTTGAPAPGVSVLVGGARVTSDANGNYDRSGLAPGMYDVLLDISAERGLPDQGTITVALGEGQTVVQHLRFHSPAPAPAPTPEAAPTPARLPVTAGEDSSVLLLALGIALLVAAACVRRLA
jgi:hypothetical protein